MVIFVALDVTPFLSIFGVVFHQIQFAVTGFESILHPLDTTYVWNMFQLNPEVKFFFLSHSYETRLFCIIPIWNWRIPHGLVAVSEVQTSKWTLCIYPTVQSFQLRMSVDDTGKRENWWWANAELLFSFPSENFPLLSLQCLHASIKKKHYPNNI